MDSLRQYFLSITACAILCAIITGLFEKNNSIYKLLKTVCGLFLISTFVRPVTEIRLDELPRFTDAVTQNAQAAISAGEDYRVESLAAIIKEETEAYILDKAQALHCTLDVEVIVEKSEQPVPAEVYITGSLSPASKSKLQNLIEQELHIAKENQIWIQ